MGGSSSSCLWGFVRQRLDERVPPLAASRCIRMAQGQTAMAWAKNEGLDNAVIRTPENSTPTSFRQWSEEVLEPAVLHQTHAVVS
jgi:hypothetical protein